MKVTQEKGSTEAVNSGVGWVGPDSKEEKMLASLEGPEAGSDCVEAQYARKRCSVIERLEARSCSLEIMTGSRETAGSTKAWRRTSVGTIGVGHLTHL